MIATGSIGAAVQGLGACSTSGDELTELLAGITGTEVVSGGPRPAARGQFLMQGYSLGLQQREVCIPNPVPLLVSGAPPLGLLWPFISCLGLEKSRHPWVG